MCVFQSPWRPDDVRFSRVGVRGCCGPPDIGTGKQIGILCKSSRDPEWTFQLPTFYLLGLLIKNLVIYIPGGAAEFKEHSYNLILFFFQIPASLCYF